MLSKERSLARGETVRAALLILLTSLAGCTCGSDDEPPGAPPADSTPGDSQPATDSDEQLPELPCDPEFTGIEPNPAQSGRVLTVAVSDDVGWVYVGLSVSGSGAPTSSLDEVSGEGPWTWTWSVTGHEPGQLAMRFTADEGSTEIASCRVWVVEGSDSGDPPAPDTGPCVPDCSEALCGADDGCGTPCAGSHRESYGGASDCRSTGYCGCGVEPNDNMECTSGGMCRVRCSCDCLAPVDRAPEDVQHLDYPGACELVFRESGDPTVWDYENDRSLCPLDHDPVGDARCSECPPCHRDHPPSCDWEDWCTCTDHRWYDEYSDECCAQGEEHCY